MRSIVTFFIVTLLVARLGPKGAALQPSEFLLVAARSPRLCYWQVHSPMATPRAGSIVDPR